MIRTEMIGDRVRTYSDAGMMILQEQTGILYEDALDYPALGRTYTETETPIADEPLSADEALNILMGRDADEPADGD